MSMAVLHYETTKFNVVIVAMPLTMVEIMLILSFGKADVDEKKMQFLKEHTVAVPPDDAVVKELGTAEEDELYSVGFQTISGVSSIVAKDEENVKRFIESIQAQPSKSEQKDDSFYIQGPDTIQ
jgi:choline-glycine betaine transporter